jgi:hypothetical protein
LKIDEIRSRERNPTTARYSSSSTEEIRHATRWSSLVHGRAPHCRHPDLDAVFLALAPTMTMPTAQTAMPLHRKESDYRRFMMRELLIWLVGVPVPIAAIIGFFAL